MLSRLHKQRHQRSVATLGAPMAVQIGIEDRTLRHRICGVKVLTRMKDARRAVAQPDLHLSVEDENPLRRSRAMERTAESRRASTQLESQRREHRREHRLRRSPGERNV